MVSLAIVLVVFLLVVGLLSFTYGDILLFALLIYLVVKDILKTIEKVNEKKNKQNKEKEET